GDDTYSLQGQASITQPGVYQTNGTWRGAAFGNSSAGNDLLGQWFDGPRWFDGDPRAGANETFAHPTQGNCPNNCDWVNATNAGSLTGVTNVHHPMHYMSQNFHWRAVAWANSGAARAADVSVFWGAGGTVDSVIDVTHNVEVPFRTDAQGSWGFLTFGAQSSETGSNDEDPTILTKGDVGCVAPLTDAIVDFGSPPACLGTSTPIQLVNTATIGPMGMGVNGSSWEDPANYSTVTTTGFMMYIVGNWFSFDMAALPAAGSIWTMRDYMGAIFGGEGRDAAGNPVDVIGPYSFEEQARPMTAIGVEMVVSYDVVNQVNAPTADDIANVHPVPDPFYITSGFDRSPVDARIEFINLPAQAIIRIYSSSGVLVDLIEHDSDQAGGSESWNVRNRNNQVVASGVYFYHVEANDQRRVGRMTIVRFAQ
ncbi:MAG: hypothetical protein V3S19_05955, partial [Gemmatimonadales bacterium]